MQMQSSAVICGSPHFPIISPVICETPRLYSYRRFPPSFHCHARKPSRLSEPPVRSLLIMKTTGSAGRRSFDTGPLLPPVPQGIFPEIVMIFHLANIVRRRSNTNTDKIRKVWSVPAFVCLLLLLTSSVSMTSEAVHAHSHDVEYLHDRTATTACGKTSNITSHLAIIARTTGRYSTHTTRNMTPQM